MSESTWKLGKVWHGPDEDMNGLTTLRAIAQSVVDMMPGASADVLRAALHERLLEVTVVARLLRTGVSEEDVLMRGVLDYAALRRRRLEPSIGEAGAFNNESLRMLEAEARQLIAVSDWWLERSDPRLRAIEAVNVLTNWVSGRDDLGMERKFAEFIIASGLLDKKGGE